MPSVRVAIFSSHRPPQRRSRPWRRRSSRAEDKAGSKLPVLGSGAHQYEAIHNWGELPAHVIWGETHGVAVDEAGLIYIKHRSTAAEPMDSIVVFDPSGKFVRSFGKEYHGGGHGIDIRKEGRPGVSLSVRREESTVRQGHAHGRAALEDELSRPRPASTRTSSSSIPRTSPLPRTAASTWPTVTARATSISTTRTPSGFARGAAPAPKKARCARRTASGSTTARAAKPPLVVADRANARLQYFTLDGKFLRIVEGRQLSRPLRHSRQRIAGARSARPRDDHGPRTTP